MYKQNPEKNNFSRRRKISNHQIRSTGSFRQILVAFSGYPPFIWPFITAAPPPRFANLPTALRGIKKRIAAPTFPLLHL